MRNTEKKTFHIGGMTCVNCRNLIEKKLKSAAGVEDAAVDFNAGTATVTYDAAAITFNEIISVIEQLDYTVTDGEAGTRRSESRVSDSIGILIIIISLYALLRGLGINTLTPAFSLAEAGMGYGMLFITGLVTSVHCAAMCGGLTLSQCLPAAALEAGTRGNVPQNVPIPAILYNAGRVVSYTAAGTVAGAAGQAVTVSGRFQGVVQLAAGVFMVLMGVSMLGLVPWLRRFTPRMPNIFARSLGTQKAARKSPLIIGLLNGLMPCGPLQAMQLYALSTGSPLAGGMSMFIFSMGTVPLMFGIGALTSFLSNGSRGRVFTRRVMKGGAILVTVMGMTMCTYGVTLSGFNINIADAIIAALYPSAASARPAVPFAPAVENGVQLVNSTLSGGRYPAITVQAGIPVKWTITAPQGSINGCNNRMIIREYKIEHRFTTGENVIEFTPEKTGRFSYSCWMGMIRSSITVVAEGQIAADDAEPDAAPAPAGVAIPTDTVRLAELHKGGFFEYKGGSQTVTVNLRDDGMTPAILVVQKGVTVVLTVNNDSLDSGNSRLLFPSYSSIIDMKQGDNVIWLRNPTEDFDFSTGDNMFYGYVKVAEDIATIDIEAIQAEVAEFETLIYPPAFFEEAAFGGCCGVGAPML
ncbi:MAG: sulfite exporter TauE/SafE family protein [Treponema sp.]|nr:sulfite exporter TauE/SafE family protein [Treponema sp.]